MAIHLRESFVKIPINKKQNKEQGRILNFNGSYPNLCSGSFIMILNNTVYNFESHSLSSGGGLDEEYNPREGLWSVNTWPANFPKELKSKAIELINQEIPHGCCGGCS